MLDEQHFRLILDLVSNQVFNGKGLERHGHGLELKEQPWKIISDNVGPGFVIGQAIKKLMELKTFSDNSLLPIEQRTKNFEAFKREALGAIVYTVMSIMYREYQLIKDTPSKKIEEAIPTCRPASDR